MGCHVSLLVADGATALRITRIITITQISAPMPTPASPSFPLVRSYIKAAYYTVPLVWNVGYLMRTESPSALCTL